MKHTLSLLFLFISFTCLAQINFEPGYYIDNNGKKTEGFIKNIAWKNNPVEFEFRNSADAETQIIKMADAKEFNVSAYRFIRYDVKMERSSNAVGKMDTKRDIKWNNETVYLKLLVQGNPSLYQYEDNAVKYFYSTGDHSTAEQLLYKEFIDDSRIHEINQYKQQLHNLMKDSSLPMRRFEQLKYEKEYLVKLFNDYYISTGAATTDYAKNQNKGMLQLKLTPGIGFSSLETSNVVNTAGGMKFGSKTIFRIGLEIEYIMPFNNNKWSLLVDPNFQAYKNTATQGANTLAVDYSVLELPMGGRHYFFLNDKARIFVNAMYVLDFSMSQSQIQFNSQEPLKFVKSTHYAVGAGFGYERFSLEARYNTTHDIMRNFAYWSAEYSTLNIIAGYRFL